MTEKYNAKKSRTKTLRFHVQTAGSTLTYQQPLNNAVRTSLQALAAVLGGVQSMHVCSYDEAICNPTEESVILSLRTQQIIQEESNVTNTVDPLAGSYFVENLTKTIEKKAWEFFEELEEQGGWGGAMDSGWLLHHREQATCQHEDDLRSGKKRVVGVNCYRDDTIASGISYFKTNPEIRNKVIERYLKLKKDRDNVAVAVQEALAELKEADDNGDNVMPATLKAAKAYATIKEMCDITVCQHPCKAYDSPFYGMRGAM